MAGTLTDDGAADDLVVGMLPVLLQRSNRLRALLQRLDEECGAQGTAIPQKGACRGGAEVGSQSRADARGAAHSPASSDTHHSGFASVSSAPSSPSTVADAQPGIAATAPRQQPAPSRCTANDRTRLSDVHSTARRRDAGPLGAHHADGGASHDATERRLAAILDVVTALAHRMDVVDGHGAPPRPIPRRDGGAMEEAPSAGQGGALRREPALRQQRTQLASAPRLTSDALRELSTAEPPRVVTTPSSYFGSEAEGPYMYQGAAADAKEDEKTTPAASQLDEKFSAILNCLGSLCEKLEEGKVPDAPAPAGQPPQAPPPAARSSAQPSTRVADGSRGGIAAAAAASEPSRPSFDESAGAGQRGGRDVADDIDADARLLERTEIAKRVVENERVYDEAIAFLGREQSLHHVSPFGVAVDPDDPESVYAMSRCDLMRVIAKLQRRLAKERRFREETERRNRELLHTLSKARSVISRYMAKRPGV